MNKSASISKLLAWFMALLLAVAVAGCGGSSTPESTTKAITAYSLGGVTGTINEAAKTIAVTMPTGAYVTGLVATFTTTGAYVKVGTTVQVSTSNANNFSSPVAYIVTAGDGSTASYTVTVTVSSAKAITAYSINGATGTITESTKTIAVTLPYGTTPLTALVAKFTTTGASVTVGTTVQTSALTPNDFTLPVGYIVTAADATPATYTVTVTIAAIGDKAITAYSIGGVAGSISGAGPFAIAATVPYGTNKTGLVATFTTTGAGVMVGTTAQISATTPNDFTAPVPYVVTAADTSTATYTVTVNIAAGPAPVNLGTAGNFVILSKTGVSTTGTTAVTGDIGVSPVAATYITGFSLVADATNQFSTSSLVTGKLYAANYAVPIPSNMTTAVGDMEIAFTDAAGRTVPAPVTELYAGDISGRTLAPGLYKWSSGLLITSAGVTLSGGIDDVWIFQIAQDLTVNNSAVITLAGGALAKNIFWQVSGKTTLGTLANFKGIILCQTLISLQTGAVLNGRALSQTAVTLDSNQVTQP